jgi:transposase InsO family protein
VKYGFIRDHANDYPVKLLCRMLSVQRSAYYDWRDRPGKVIGPEELLLRRRMKALFAASRGSMGSRMMMNNLREEGFEIGRDKTRRLMKALKLKVKQKRKYKATTDSKHKLPVARNVLNRDFSPSAPNQAWGTDITYLWTQEGWVYLAVVIDLYSRRVVGWSINRRMKKALVIRALIMAVNLRKPPPGLIHHSDHLSSVSTPVASIRNY